MCRCARVFPIISHASDDGNNPPPSVLFLFCHSFAATARTVRFPIFPFFFVSSRFLFSLSLSLLTSVCVVRLRRWQILYQLHIHSIEAELKSFLSFERKIDNQKKKELVRLVVVLVVSRFGCLWPYFMFR